MGGGGGGVYYTIDNMGTLNGSKIANSSSHPGPNRDEPPLVS